MTDQNNAAQTAAQSEAPARAAGDKWIERFGTIKSIALKSGRKGQYAVVTIDCVKFEQTAFAFTAKTIDAIKAAGEGSKIWLKGPMEAVQRKNENGGTYSEDQLKIVYFKDKTVREDAAAAAEGEAQAVSETAGTASDETASQTAEQMVDDEIPF